MAVRTSKRRNTRGKSSTRHAVSSMTPPKTSVFYNLGTKLRPLPRWGLHAILFGGLLLALVLWQKEWIIAASINGRPVTGLELFKRMSRDYRGQALDNLVNEKLILQEAQKRNAVPSDVEIEARLIQVETQYGGKDSFEMLLKQQGQTRESVKGQLKLTLAMEKMFGNEATATPEEVLKYVLENKEFLQATDSAGQKLEAEKNLRDQKLREIFATKFNELKANANIRIF